VSAGFRDVYAAWLPFQWVDVSATQPGTYTLRSEVDPDGIIKEVNESNGYGSTAVQVPGYKAKRRILSRASADSPASVALGVDAVLAAGRDLAPPQYRIETPPQHGTLSVPTGHWFTGDEIGYTPDAGSPGPDQFAYSARELGSEFPTGPEQATVSLGVGQADQVAIAGAPGAIVVGAGAQLTAETTSGDGPVAWYVDGVRGGTDRSGHIDPSGLYTAPAGVPSSETVTVRAVGASGAFAKVVIHILPAPPVVPIPAPQGLPVGPADAAVPPRALAPLPPAALPPRIFADARAQLVGRLVAVSVIPGRPGRLRIVLRRGSHRIGACDRSVVAGRAYLCRLRPSGRGGALEVVALMRPTGGRAVARTLPIRTGHIH
jgi:hypothetical protein